MTPQDWLARLAGDWTYDGHAVPDDAGQRRSGTETVRTAGCWALIESDDHACLRLAFNPETGRFVGDFIHLEHPHLWTYDGILEDGRLRLFSTGPSFDVEGESAEYEDRLEILSPDERLMTGRLKGADGVWRDFTVTRYRRKGATE